MAATIVQRPDHTPPAQLRFDRRLSAAVDRIIVQAEAAEATGDAETARAWHRVLRDLEQTIPAMTDTAERDTNADGAPAIWKGDTGKGVTP